MCLPSPRGAVPTFSAVSSPPSTAGSGCRDRHTWAISVPRAEEVDLSEVREPAAGRRVALPGAGGGCPSRCTLRSGDLGPSPGGVADHIRPAPEVAVGPQPEDGPSWW